MYVTSVIPIARNRASQTLSYFSTFAPKIGSFVTVPMRLGKAPAIVVEVKNAQSAKTDLKSASFALKKISEQGFLDVGLSQAFMKASEHTGKFYAAPTSAILSSVIPKLLLEEPDLLGKPSEASDTLSEEPMILQLEKEERMGLYRSIVRESFAKKKSIMFLVPTHEDGVRAQAELSKGISDRVYFFSLSKKKKDQRTVWQKAKESPMPVLFITTPAGLAFDREDLGIIVLERENSRAYRSMVRPFIKTKVFVENLARESKRRLIMGDSVLSVETLWLGKSGKYAESHVKWRLSPPGKTSLIDMKLEEPEKAKAGFEILSPELKALIQKSQEEKSSMFLFGARKGLAPSTICGDCGAVLSCKNCRAPVVLHEKKEDRRYICHACGLERASLTLCDGCGSWKLEALGIGTDRIYKEVRRLFPKARVWVLDKDKAPTDVLARGIAKEFLSKGGIMIGTELAFSYIESVPYSAIVSLDALFSIPDFGINERIFYLVSHIREMAQKETLIQTRNIGKNIITAAALGNTLEFYSTEIADREQLSYPPLSIFLKVMGKNILKVKERFAKWNPELVRESLVMRLPRDAWPETELTSELSLLTPDFLIKVDPESIL